MKGESFLQLKNYLVKKCSFELVDDFNFEEENQINIIPIFNRAISKIDKNNFVLDLEVKINEEKNNKIPFAVYVHLQALFNMQEWEKNENQDIAINNTTSILFPYLREVVSSLTRNANLPAYNIPVMNIIALFEEQEKINTH